MRFTISLTIEISREGKSKHSQSWASLKNQIRQRDNATCRYCGEFILDGHVDHVVPISRGGTDDLNNLVWSCPECNISKGDKTPEEWGVTLLEPRMKCTKVEIIEPEKPDDLFDLPVRKEILNQLAVAILEDNRNFSRRSLSPDIISECQFNRLLGVMLEKGLARYKNNRPQAGTELTFKGNAMFQKFLNI